MKNDINQAYIKDSEAFEKYNNETILNRDRFYEG